MTNKYTLVSIPPNGWFQIQNCRSYENGWLRGTHILGHLHTRRIPNCAQKLRPLACAGFHLCHNFSRIWPLLMSFAICVWSCQDGFTPENAERTRGITARVSKQPLPCRTSLLWLDHHFLYANDPTGDILQSSCTPNKKLHSEALATKVCLPTDPSHLFSITGSSSAAKYSA